MKTIFASFLLSLFVIPFSTVALAPDTLYSSIGTNRDSLKADGIDNAIVSVTVKDMNLMQLEGLKVTLTSSRGAQDEIVKQNDTTDAFGKARFLVRSLRDGTSVITAKVGDVSLQKSVTLTFKDGLQIPLSVGDLIKIPDDNDAKNLSDTAVYYYASNGKRYVFPNEKTYFTWYPDFSKVKIIPLDQMSLIPIGANVTYHPGSRLVKFQTDPKTYIVTRGGVLRWAKTEEVARGWFGSNWNQYIDDISEAFYITYTLGNPIDSHLDLALDIIHKGTHSIDQDKGLSSP